MMGGYMIRDIKVEDASSIALIARVSLGYNVTIEKVASNILNIQNHFTKVFEKENRVVGFIQAEVYHTLYSDSGFNILGLAVLPEYQGQGIGSELMDVLEQEKNLKQYNFIRLNSGVERVKAHQFYQHKGYVATKEQKRFIKL